MRVIFGPKRDDDGTYRVLYNHDSVRCIKSQRVRWLGHVLRADSHRNVQRSLKGEPPYGSRRGR